MPADPGRRGSPDATDRYQTCPQCGCPHKMDASVCSFCGVPLSSKPPVAERLRRAMETVKWRYKIKGRKASYSAGRLASRLFTLSLGAALVVLGGWFIVRAVGSASFSEFLIGALFSIYGVYSSAAVLKNR